MANQRGPGRGCTRQRDTHRTLLATRVENINDIASLGAPHSYNLRGGCLVRIGLGHDATPKDVRFCIFCLLGPLSLHGSKLRLRDVLLQDNVESISQSHREAARGPEPLSALKTSNRTKLRSVIEMCFVLCRGWWLSKSRRETNTTLTNENTHKLARITATSKSQTPTVHRAIRKAVVVLLPMSRLHECITCDVGVQKERSRGPCANVRHTKTNPLRCAAPCERTPGPCKPRRLGQGLPT